MRRLVLVITLAACQKQEPAPPPPSPPRAWAAYVESKQPSGNLIVNGGFEDGVAPWFVPDLDHWVRAPEVVTSVARTGKHALRGFVEAAPGDARQMKSGAMYTLGALPFPRHVSFWYRVARWEPANVPQYILFVVVVSGAGGDNYQLRYFVTGPDTMPYKEGGNVAYTLVHKGAPPVGGWAQFTTDLHRDFREKWGRVPDAFESLRFGVMVRYDADRVKVSKPLAAEVFFDDLYVGWAASKP